MELKNRFSLQSFLEPRAIWTGNQPCRSSALLLACPQVQGQTSCKLEIRDVGRQLRRRIGRSNFDGLRFDLSVSETPFASQAGDESGFAS